MVIYKAYQRKFYCQVPFKKVYSIYGTNISVEKQKLKTKIHMTMWCNIRCILNIKAWLCFDRFVLLLTSWCSHYYNVWITRTITSHSNGSEMQYLILLLLLEPYLNSHLVNSWTKQLWLILRCILFSQDALRSPGGVLPSYFPWMMLWSNLIFFFLMMSH